MKFDPFGAAWRVQERRDDDLSIDIVAAVRDAVGPDVDLLGRSVIRAQGDE